MFILSKASRSHVEIVSKSWSQWVHNSMGSMGKLRARCDGLHDRPSYASHQMRHAGDGSIVRGGVEECGTRIKFERHSFGLV